MAASVSVLSVALAACGNDSGGGDSTAVADPAGIAAAEAYLASVSENPSDIGLTVPLSKKPDAGIYIIRLQSGEPVAKLESDAMAAGAQALGWRFETVSVAPNAEGPQQALQSAIAKKPDGISFSGAPSSAFGAATVQAAADAGIALLGDTVVEDPSGPIISTSLDNATQVANWGKMVAAQFVVNSKGLGHGATFTLSEYPILVAWQEAVKKYVDEWCPACKLTEIDSQASDIGTKLPASLVSTFQRDPSLKYAMFSVGDMTLGLTPAMQAAGLSDVEVSGETPAEANIEAIRAGTEAGWTGFPVYILGWRVIDMWARHFNGDDLAPAEKVLLPLQMITPDNIDDVELNDAGYYVGVSDYEDEFKKLWLVN
ncbi:substrate-binding domain-containing protein [Aeromicrobium sp.]|uniref:substrate-binding domain-containing protein n=1 Tax=Aeromicrobium sp. TaxID=1871063 RepID=UPI001999606D|nr:substrate-binding domain-containing protein [Aeromicrobium sp.]MBC7630958.1 substrate-binding domain-containing protein [Aeromicrobium sp.]